MRRDPDLSEKERSGALLSDTRKSQDSAEVSFIKRLNAEQLEIRDSKLVFERIGLAQEQTRDRTRGVSGAGSVS